MFKTWDGSRFHSHPRKNLNLHKAKSKINRCSNSLSRTGSSSRPLMPRETRRVLTPVVSELKEWNMLMEFSLRAKGGEHRMVSWLRCLLDVSHSAGNTRENLIFFKPRMSRRKRFNLSRYREDCLFTWRDVMMLDGLLGNDISSKIHVNFGLGESIDIASTQIDFDSVV